MKFFYYLLQIPPFVLLMIIVLSFTFVGVAGTYYFRKYAHIHPLRSHNEMVGYVFGALGGFYGLLLGFVVFLVWSSYSDAQTDNSREGSLARSLYRDIKYYPVPAKVAALRESYVAYVHRVVEDEFPDMEVMAPLNAHNRAAFNNVFRTMGQLPMNDSYSAQMFRQLNDLDVYRSLRQLDATSSIPIEIWIPLLLGGAVILVFAMLVDVESRRLHMGVNGLLGAFIGLV